MCYDHEKKKGIKDVEFGTRRVYLHKDITYAHMVKKMSNYLFPGDTSGEYYIADKLGQSLCMGDGKIVTANAEGKEQSHPWTLALYLKVSGIKYPSRTGFYCVQKLPCKTTKFYFTFCLLFLQQAVWMN